ncbi:MAG: hypothetical protein HIU85_09815 [Proteobacteria bacterium]|nr:hypothetical protein [Pseudomonadota bacterium]
MRKISVIVACWLTLLSSAAARAAEADFPALGVRLTDLPAEARSLGVGETLKAYDVEIQFGRIASARISRYDEALPSGDIGQKAYRDALFSRLGVHRANGTLHRLVAIAGHPAWAIAAAQRLGPIAVYDSSYYLIVRRHLYEITISAAGKAQPANSSFDSVSNAIASGIVFEPVQRPPEKPLAPGQMPRFLMGSQAAAFYPPRELRAERHGIVELTFNIDGDGAARDLKVAGDANQNFARVALSMLKDGGFKIPPGWLQSGGPKEKFTMEFRFELTCPAAHPLPKLVPQAQLVTLCGSNRTLE